MAMLILFPVFNGQRCYFTTSFVVPVKQSVDLVCVFVCLRVSTT